MNKGKVAVRSAELAARLGESATALISVVEGVNDVRWTRVPAPGVWSVGKEAEHVAEAAAYHQWIVRLTIGQHVSSRRPAIERTLMVTDLTPAETANLLRQRTADGVRLVLDLRDDELDLPTRPPRATGERLADSIARVLIAHYDAHRAAIEAKLRDIDESS